MGALDGFFEGPKSWDLDWHDYAWGEEMETLLRAGLVDEYRIGLTPVVLGGGKPLFKPSPDKLKMKLLEARPLQTGCGILRYRPEGATNP